VRHRRGVEQKAGRPRAAAAHAVELVHRGRTITGSGATLKRASAWPIAAWRSSTSRRTGISRWPRSRGRFILCYNGEIYNHAALRAELDGRGGGINWRGHSDTETLVEAIAGLEAALGKCVGMFALALWDRATRTLLLARDRFEEKPLYYG